MLKKSVPFSLVIKFCLFFASVFCLPIVVSTIGNISGNNFWSVQIAEAQSTDLTPEQEAVLRAQLADIENQIKQQQTILNSTAVEGKQYQHEIDVLNAKIKQAQLKIKAKELSINKLGKDITVKSNTITALSTRINNGRDSLQQIIQRTREIDNFSYAEAMLSTQNISEFFIDLDSFASIKQSLQTHLYDIKNAKSENENVKKDLDTKRSEEIDTKVSIENEKSVIERAETQKKSLLALNKNQQQNYKTVIANNTKKAAEIRNQLFKLRDVEAIKFGDAVTYAKAASAITGTRAAFILAIIQQESNLGANVGQCYLTDPATGAGIKKNSGVAVSNLMKASRDVQPFLDITSALGRDPYKTVVSCPLNIGYGGAMGPAQFIPSTWKLFQSKIARALGKPASDPWNPQDAFMASGFYLADLGASSQAFTDEKNAACRYYSGRSCSAGTGNSYGNQVMARVQAIQTNIDILSGN
ncbi:MAG: lytic murein transglycosylase [Candidatus Pacebacteria bacterium]|nr:lytic murein transglycosylase [Candidatus Paceibacterota bacterium]